MNIDNALAAHAAWKVKLRSAIADCETLDVRAIGADNCCELGKWLHGDAKALLGGRATYADCVEKHAAFHREAGRVAQEINARRMEAASAMLDVGGAYMNASNAVGVAISRLKREMAPA